MPVREARGRFGSLGPSGGELELVFQLFSELLRRQLDLPEDLASERPGDVAPGVAREGCRATVNVPVEDVA